MAKKREPRSEQLHKEWVRLRAEQTELENSAGLQEKTGFPRDLYFAVADEELRRKLIAKCIEIDRVNQDWTIAVKEEARLALRRERRAGPRQTWWLGAAISGCGFVLLGNYLYGIPGAICGGVVALLAGRSGENAAAIAHTRRLMDLEEELKEAEADVADIGPSTFSLSEQLTGRPADRATDGVG